MQANPPLHAPFDRLAKRRTRASTLLESVVALGILGTAMAVLAQLMFAGLTQSASASRRAQALLFAQSTMEELFLNRHDLAAWEARLQKDQPLEAMSDSFLFRRTERESYRWTYAINPVEGMPGLKHVVVCVYWPQLGSKGQSAPCRLESLMAVPESVAAMGRPAAGEARP